MIYRFLGREERWADHVISQQGTTGRETNRVMGTRSYVLGHAELQVLPTMLPDVVF